MYDWANSAFQTTIITAVFPRFFSDYAAAGLDPTEATARFAWATTIAVTITALIGPVLGAIADIRGLKKTLLGVSMSVGIVATLLMATIARGDWMFAAMVFMIANIGIAASFVFYDSLLPHIAALRDAADAIGGGTREDLATIDEALDFLSGHLYPHARAEDDVLYPAVAAAMGQRP